MLFRQIRSIGRCNLAQLAQTSQPPERYRCEPRGAVRDERGSPKLPSDHEATQHLPACVSKRRLERTQCCRCPPAAKLLRRERLYGIGGSEQHEGGASVSVILHTARRRSSLASRATVRIARRCCTRQVARRAFLCH